ncbi:hypothetical protein AYI69_g1603 [Smittium culicis]|uniref:EF-hand domain-containing protein n=1 Tax=Smittium culicis TaxID=133412 RepID=A0A1R1YPZ3_9FUNG|nr:hypothetical protein AYI69_g1603 [Smittium culicis]
MDSKKKYGKTKETYVLQTDKENFKLDKGHHKAVNIQSTAVDDSDQSSWIRDNERSTFHKSVYKDRISRQKKISGFIRHIESIEVVSKNNFDNEFDSNLRLNHFEKKNLRTNTIRRNKNIKAKAIKRGHDIFYRVISDPLKKELFPEDFLNIYTDKEKAIDIFNLFDRDNKGTIEKHDFIDTFKQYYAENGVLSESVMDMSQVLGKVHKFCLATIAVILIVFMLMFVTADPLKNIASFGALIVGKH